MLPFFSALRGKGEGPARYELSRSDDEVDCGRGRERSSADGNTMRTEYKKRR